MSEHHILAINPGSTSTKFAVYRNEQCVLNKTLRHSVDELSAYADIIEQFGYRKGMIIDALVEEGIEIDRIKNIIGRGGLTYPLESGVYLVDQLMLQHARAGIYGKHASNLGPIIADYIASQIPGAHAYIADPVVTDELEDIARITGHPKFRKRSIFHALNQKATARVHARKTGRAYEEMRLIVVHLGGGVSVGAHLNGRVVDVNNALDGDGPFSPERSGSLPVGQLIDLCYSGKYSQAEIYRMIVGEGGYVAYLGTNNALEVKNRAEAGDEAARMIEQALGYQVAKSIGEMAVVLTGQVDGILLTGGMAYNETLVNQIKERVGFIASVFVYPGEDELEALAMNALMVARGELKARKYAPRMDL
ncbi:butyrate kinase [Mangrovibacterium diazotrophicum]|uniref:Probable butyrate kinase n=1 Tax=Mangrovibacterium diazotrophicum TaxID=1261403 RepID=A0A419VUF5_9BACT|nr:butyrate kinase [Mangrovibacterium diazotrophicum]RKD85027.1 butyrate kinase [Mangrovibacterium diazotrophicum]